MDTESNGIVVLTDVVRDQYIRYLERQLRENVCVWASTSRNHHKPSAWACIDNSLKTLESRALKACQAAQLYQRAMVKMIAAVRRNTQECRLADSLFDHMQRLQEMEDASYSPLHNSAPNEKAKPIQLVDKSTQTSNESLPNGDDCNEYDTYSLSQKIDLFQSRLSEQEKEQAEVTSCSPMLSTEDAVAQELAKLFDDEPNDLNVLFGLESTTIPSATISEAPQDVTNQISPVLKGSTPTISPDYAQPKKTKHSYDLRNSLWPCELYAQRRQLNECLVRLLDADWRCEDTLRYKFHVLFGEDSDDEFTAQISSPSIDLVDEVLLASCILRIRPWIVRHLMRPLQEGLIANRFLFKKLAKMLAINVVMANPYASERQVKCAVEQVFCTLSRGVQVAQDLDSLPMNLIGRFED